MNRVRQAAAWTYRVLITLFAAAAIVEVFLVILIAGTRLRSIGATLGVAVMTLVEGALGGAGEDAPVAGAFHAINAVLVLGLALFLTARAWRGNLLIPPVNLRRIARAPVPAPSMPAPTPTPSERVV